ncbi:MAG: response regulator transcription factor [Candidatus Brocadiaceae bacterium]
MPKEKILVVDDEQDLVKLVRYHLEKEGYKVLSAFNGEDALFMAIKERPALIILDLMLPGIDGFEVCKKLKADPVFANTAIIMLTAKGEEADIITGLKLGADDYITKPFSPKELAARTQAVLRRIQSTSAIQDYIKIYDLKIDLSKYEVTIKDEPISLTLTEFKILCHLAGRPGRIFTRDQLLSEISGSDTITTARTIDVHMASLRKKLKDFSSHIMTIHGLGYKFGE